MQTQVEKKHLTGLTAEQERRKSNRRKVFREFLNIKLLVFIINYYCVMIFNALGLNMKKENLLL